MIRSFCCLLFLLQSFSKAAAQDFFINKDTTINGVWTLPKGSLLRFGSNGYIRGSGTIKGGIIDAAPNQWIFDSSLTLQPEGTYSTFFSARWLGAGYVKDNAGVLQKGIQTVLENYGPLKHFFIPAGLYKYSKPLQVFRIYKDKYTACTIHIFGESSFWDSGTGTTLEYTGTSGFALGLQLNKGSEINNLILKGQFKAPAGNDSTYYNIPFDKYKDANGICDDLYAGIVIDYDGTKNSGGSTGLKLHDLSVGNFTINYLISPNGKTFNADILLFENIRCGDAKVGFANGQAQEKGNVIRGIYSWGSVHTLFSSGRYGKKQAGSYTIDGGNIAGRCIRLFDLTQAGWYNTNISNIYAESIASVGHVSTQIPVSISNSTFHFVYSSVIGKQTLFSCNSEKVAFTNCIFRYYGRKDPMLIRGNCTFTNCHFSGPRVKE